MTFISSLSILTFIYYLFSDAEEALQEMDGRVLDGRELRVQMARYGRPTSPKRGGGGRYGDRRRGGRYA